MVRVRWSLPPALAAMLVVSGATALAAAGPETTITAGPTGPTRDSSPNFAFESSDPEATLECSLDNAAFSPCTSPKSYAGVTESAHAFAVRAVDSAGNVDPTPAQRSFTVDAHVDATASAARRQHEHGHAVVAARIDAMEPVTARVEGKVALGRETYRLGPVRVRVRPGRTVLHLKPVDPNDGEKIVQALEHGATARAKLDVRLADVLANELVERLNVALNGERVARGA